MDLLKRRIVVKVGTTNIMRENRSVNLNRLDKLARVLSDAKNMGNEIVLVSSGAIAVGSNKLGFRERPRELRIKQAVAAVGQLELMHLYEKLFAEYGQTVGQILLTDEDVKSEQRRENLIRTFDALFELGVIPVVNENDSVSSVEIETGHNKILGDNDTLSAIVAVLCKADKLILLSDVDKLYDCDPHSNPNAKPVNVVTEITSALREMAGGSGSGWGTGGMSTKLQAAEVAMKSGVEVTITDGDHLERIYDILEGCTVGTRFVPTNRKD
ncbi:MAG: glutamate 5-kinase [Clostridiales bacterium]|nr:glutamate 5-kinase [Clostridiales bacterium]